LNHLKQSMKTSIDKTSFISHFTGFLFILIALSDILHSKEVVLVSAILSVLAFLFCFPMKDRKFFSESMLFILFLIIMSLINLFFTQNGIGGTLPLLGNLLLAYIYLRVDNKKVTLWVILAYLITISFISYSLFVLKLPANDIYEGLSRNHAGFAVVFWTIFLLFHLKVTYNRFPIIIPLIGLIISFSLFGRTSLIVSGALLLIVFFYNFKDNISMRIIVFTIFLVICYYLWLKFGSLLIEGTNFSEGLDTPRWKLWGIYFQNIDFINFFTGIDLNTLPMYNQFGGNPHNSFIKFHSRVGIGSIVFIFLFFISVFKYVIAKQFYIFWLLILLTTRAFFDSDILIGNFDFIFFIITFYWIKTE